VYLSSVTEHCMPSR